MRRVLALQHVWDDPLGYLGEILQEHAIDCEVINVEEAPIPDPGGYDALIVLGGPQHVPADDKYPYLTQEKALIRKAVEQDVPLLGICLGGQLLAHALGAEVRRHHMIELGFFKVQLTDEGKIDPLFQGLPGHEQVFHWHLDVFEIPSGGVQLATSENAPNQAFRFGRRAYGLQYHIELTPDMFHTWLRYLPHDQEVVNTLGPDIGERIEHEQSQCYPIYRDHSHIVFENFLKISGL